VLPRADSPAFVGKWGGDKGAVREGAEVSGYLTADSEASFCRKRDPATRSLVTEQREKARDCTQTPDYTVSIGCYSHTSSSIRFLPQHEGGILGVKRVFAEGSVATIGKACGVKV
jgi:hypothetical protein